MTHDVAFPVHRRHPFDLFEQQITIPAVKTSSLPGGIFWPTAGSDLGPAASPPTIIPVNLDFVATVQCGTAPMLVEHGDEQAQYRFATTVASIQILEQNRLLQATETLYANAQMVGSIQGFDGVLKNAYPDMVRVNALQQTNVTYARCDFPIMTAPPGTVCTTIGLRIIFLLTLQADPTTDLLPLTIRFRMDAAAAVADPVVGRRV
jgi:hypothetical protein